MQSFFSNAICKLFRGNHPRQNFVVTCSGKNFGGSYPGCIVQRGIIHGKMFGVKSPGGNCPGGSFMGVTCLGGNCPGRKLFRGNYLEGKSPEDSFLFWGFYRGKLSWG